MVKVTKLQKTAVTCSLLTGALMFVLALGYSTNVYVLYAFTSSRRHLDGAELYLEIQPFNKALLGYAALMIVLSVFLFATLTHKRRLYYLANYIASGLYSAFAVFVGVITFVNTLSFKERFSNLDFVKLKELVDTWGGYYTESPFFFNVALVFSGICILTAALVAVNAIVKAIAIKKEKAAGGITE